MKSPECTVCSHRCTLSPEKFGKCGVRKNSNGKIVPVTYGRLIARQIDPIEKKPLFHFLPSTQIYSIALPGCNFTCQFCQNWEISQIRGQSLDLFLAQTSPILPEKIIEYAQSNRCKSIAFTYTEPTVFYEYMREVAICAKENGLKTVAVSNGFMTGEVLQSLLPVIDAFNIDLKSFDEKFYREICNARLEPVLETLREISSSGNWLEITTLLIPGKNDSEDELHKMAEFISGLGEHIPWHISRFFPRFNFVNMKATPLAQLVMASEIGKNHSLKYIYTGNSGSTVTVCPECRQVLITRNGFVTELANDFDGVCKNCGEILDGVWS